MGDPLSFGSFQSILTFTPSVVVVGALGARGADGSSRVVACTTGLVYPLYPCTLIADTLNS